MTDRWYIDGQETEPPEWVEAWVAVDDVPATAFHMMLTEPWRMWAQVVLATPELPAP